MLPAVTIHRMRWLSRLWRSLAAVAVACAILLGVAVSSAAAQGTGYSVTFVARQCRSYQDIFANRFRDNLMQTLQNVGPNSPYGPDDLVDANVESTTRRVSARRSRAGNSRWHATICRR